MADDTLSFMAGGARYDLRMEDLTGEDAIDYRREVGLRLQDVFDNDKFDIDLVAGLVWLIRRRGDQKLTYRQCAAVVNYGNFELIEDDSEEADDRGEASGGS